MMLCGNKNMDNVDLVENKDLIDKFDFLYKYPIPGNILIKDCDSRFQSASKGFASMLGYDNPGVCSIVCVSCASQ